MQKTLFDLPQSPQPSQPERNYQEEIRRIKAAYIAAGFPKIYKWTEARLSRIRARIKNPGYVKDFEKAMQIASRTPFLKGENPRCWKADFDFFIRPNIVSRIIEGRYGDSYDKENEDKQAAILFLKEKLDAEIARLNKTKQDLLKSKTGFIARLVELRKIDKQLARLYVEYKRKKGISPSEEEACNQIIR